MSLTWMPSAKAPLVNGAHCLSVAPTTPMVTGLAALPFSASAAPSANALYPKNAETKSAATTMTEMMMLRVRWSLRTGSMESGMSGWSWLSLLTGFRLGLVGCVWTPEELRASVREEDML